MTDQTQAIWLVFILGTLAIVILLVAVVVTLVLSHRRYIKLHRSQARRVLEALEEERAWVSREVHDDAVQRLMLIGRECGDSQRAVATLAPQEAKRLEALQAELEDLSVFLRGLAHRLHPAQLDRVGLCAALRSLQEELDRSYHLRVRLELPPGDRLQLAPQRQLVLFRIAQEALHNIVKHAQVDHAEMTLSDNHDGTLLTVSDRGRGFDLNKPNLNQGIGLVGIKERAYLAEGEVEISSTPGQGTVVRARLPQEGRTA